METMIVTPLQRLIAKLKKQKGEIGDNNLDISLTYSQAIIEAECLLEAENQLLIDLADWKDKLQPNEKVSVWSKNGEHQGLFNMDNEQLLEKFLNRKVLKEHGVEPQIIGQKS